MLSWHFYAQTPTDFFSYQIAVVDASNNPPAIGSTVRIRISILDNTAAGPQVYQEVHTKVMNNSTGILNLEIGNGTDKVGDFSMVNWSLLKFLKTEVDLTGAYVDMGTTRILSTPHSKYADNAKNLGITGTGFDMLSHDGSKWTAAKSPLITTPSTGDYSAFHPSISGFKEGNSATPSTNDYFVFNKNLTLTSPIESIQSIIHASTYRGPEYASIVGKNRADGTGIFGYSENGSGVLATSNKGIGLKVSSNSVGANITTNANSNSGIILANYGDSSLGMQILNYGDQSRGLLVQNIGINTTGADISGTKGLIVKANSADSPAISMSGQFKVYGSADSRCAYTTTPTTSAVSSITLTYKNPKPTDIILITPNTGTNTSTILSMPSGRVAYGVDPDIPSNILWYIINTTGANFPIGTSFNVMVIRQ